MYDVPTIMTINKYRIAYFVKERLDISLVKNNCQFAYSINMCTCTINKQANDAHEGNNVFGTKKAKNDWILSLSVHFAVKGIYKKLQAIFTISIMILFCSSPI